MANKWIILDGKKQPDFDARVLISFEDGSWAEAYLDSITEDSVRKIYKFIGTDEQETEYRNATHYFIPTPPKNNQ